MNKYRILVIDDEPQMRRLLQLSLEAAGYEVMLAENAKAGQLAAINHPPDLIVLDLGLPDKSGQDLLVELKMWYNRAIIILSAHHTEADIVQALDHGASDYLTKPFRNAELLARIRACIRRDGNQTLEEKIQFDNWSIDLSARVVKKDQEVVKLTTTEFNLLALMARNAGRVLTHQFLLQEIWGITYLEQTQYLRVYIGNLRKKIEQDHNHPKYIITESGVGYRLAQP